MCASRLHTGAERGARDTAWWQTASQPSGSPPKKMRVAEPQMEKWVVRIEIERFQVTSLRLVEPAKLRQDAAEFAARLRVIRSHDKRSAQRSLRLAGLAHASQNDAAVDMRRGQFRHQIRGAGRVFERGAVQVPINQQGGEVAMRLREIGLQRDRGAVAVRCFAESPQR